jgi:flagellar biosynthesis GTPase FlhF
MVRLLRSQAPPRLTPEQASAVNSLLKLRRPVQTLGGHAGCGKTTCLAALAARLPTFACCAYTVAVPEPPHRC